ncbi:MULTISPECIES: DMT family transporter [Arcobacteraceae]|uniref:EamA family transporter n=1 Tax=Poseidonibacter parvus TaxID=1850254 RepID=A0A1P8KKH5_9BACT|nr:MULTISPECIES: DMT family transporter [Arcobacteraceae]APW65062.1 EamA family transporter [Poseidonibacter parvus]
MININKETLKLLTFIVLALIFLALNSILCKAALVNNYIDAYTFTFLRLFSASITLIAIYLYKNKRFSISLKSNWITSFMLFLYAICFSFSFLSIDAGLGTLLLFGVVQIIMALSAIFLKEKVNLQKILGIAVALGGLIFLLYPKHDFEISYFHAFLMALAGTSWAVYTIMGKKSIDALSNTMDNFIKATLFITLTYFLFLNEDMFFTTNGIFLAFISGSITSAIGYVIWYEVLPKMQILTAGVIQLFVPVISIFFSVVLLGELFTLDLFLSTIIISLGIVITLFSRKTKKEKLY